MLVDPRLARSLYAKAPPPLGRMPLKSWLVFFYRNDWMALMPSIADVPLVDDDVELEAMDVDLDAVK
jgi:hypothetical protein